MNVALIGLPQSGKSTLFAAITAQKADAYAPVEVRHGIVNVPDERITYLTKICNPKKVVEATIEFMDVPGFSLEDPKGQADLRRLLPTMRQAELLVVVVRDFENASVPMYKNRIDPMADFGAVWEELIFADLDTVTTRLERIDKALKKPTKSHEEEKRQQALLLRCNEALESSRPLSSVIKSEDDKRLLSSFAFLTEKPIVCVRNVSDDQAVDASPLEAEHIEATIALSASIEAEIASLDPEDRGAFLADLGLEALARDRLIRLCYQAGGLISFLTMGADEVRAWTITRGSTAVEAAGKIHSDLARGFIRAETVAYDDLVACTDLKGARAAGKLRKEGKGYVVSDGDILNILAGV